MVELPDDTAPNGATMALLDFGMTLRSSTGAGSLRLNRKGSRWRASISLPPMPHAKGRIVIARLVKGKREGLRIPFPLLESQGIPGSPVVDGAAPTGHSLPVRGLTPGYAIKEGYWLSIEDGDGQHYLHTITAAAVADASGDATLTIEPELRTDFADGDTIHLAEPMIEGFVQGEEWGWSIPLDRLIRIEFPLEEAA
jgi:hypothetical protein